MNRNQVAAGEPSTGGGGRRNHRNPLDRPAAPSLTTTTASSPGGVAGGASDVKAAAASTQSSSSSSSSSPVRPTKSTATTTTSSTTTTTTTTTTAAPMTIRAAAGSSSSGLDRQSLIYMTLLAVQFGLQPMLTRRFTPQGVTRSTVILAQEMTKLLLAAVMLYISTGGAPIQAGIFQDWSVANWIEVAGVPAALYAVQNVAALRAYQNLDALTFNVLNQTKTLSAALCCYLIMGKRQSKVQVFALLLLLVAALVMEKIVKVNDIVNFNSSAQLFRWDYWKDWSAFSSSLSGTATTSSRRASETTGASKSSSGEDVDHNDGSKDNNNNQQQQGASSVDVAANALNTTTTLLSNAAVQQQNWDASRFTMGVAPILLASFISGLAGALSQRNLQRTTAAGNTGGRNAYLYSMELCVASVLLLLSSWIVSNDGRDVYQRGFFAGWTLQTWIPILTNSFGGILVGLVTKYAGSVRKGFALIFGILLSGIVQAALSSQSTGGGGVGVSMEQWLGGLLAVISLYLHATHPPKPTVTAKAVKQD